jgi:nicotinate-nucleotide pyrophosphorylase (carboxylating)
MTLIKPDFTIVNTDVRNALKEDIGSGDLTASLIPEKAIATATIISREAATISGIPWVNTVFEQIDSNIQCVWQVQDGDKVTPDTLLCTLTGNARNLLIGERTALNFLQTLSGTATLVRQYTDTVIGIDVQILDTRKTIPGLRIAQKYAVRCGGGVNHRVGLYDGILIKENHILAAGSIAAAIQAAQQLNTGIPVEVEVENEEELKQTLAAKADIILLDNFAVPALKKAVALTQGQALLEASGGINLNTLRGIAETGVDRISIGALTKDIRALDLSMRFL